MKQTAFDVLESGVEFRDFPSNFSIANTGGSFMSERKNRNQLHNQKISI